MPSKQREEKSNLVVEEEVHVGAEREAEHEEREDNHLRPREALNLDLRMKLSSHGNLHVNLGAQEGGDVLGTHGILQLEVVVRIELFCQERRMPAPSFPAPRWRTGS